ncbi:MAG: DUF1566 domain-containing protein [bacterium]
MFSILACCPVFGVEHRYWSSNVTVDEVDEVYIADFLDGSLFCESKESYSFVCAVRGKQQSNIFMNNNDGTITDTSTGLMWQQAITEKMIWEDAINYCENLSLGGYSDWRLPNKNELQSIVDYSCYSPAINLTYFPDTPETGIFWSSTVAILNPDTVTDIYITDAWVIYFDYGIVYGQNRSWYPQYFRAVRSAKIESLPTNNDTDATNDYAIPTKDEGGGGCFIKTILR